MAGDLVDRVRQFNRDWTEVLRLLDEGLLDTDHSLAEARVIFELGTGGSWPRGELRSRLGMDPSFLTRVLTRLQDRGLVSIEPSSSDGRRLVVALTGRGRAAFRTLDRRSVAQIEELLAPLGDGERATIVEWMTVVSSTLRRRRDDRRIELRPPRPGDLGWVVQRHGEVYADEYGWDEDFEGLVARVIADFHTTRDDPGNRAWIAEVDGARAGFVLCCRRHGDTAQLRLLLVERWARGLGIGSRLVEECLAFARRSGYRRLMLWTNDVLVSARRIYEANGFRLVEEEPHHSFGHDLVGQNWELELAGVGSEPG